MRRTGKVVLLVLGIAVLGVGGTVFYLFTQLDSLVKTAVQEIGTRAVGTTVSLGAAAIDAGDGRGTLTDLRVANPTEFSDSEAISIAETSVSIDLSSLTGDTVVVRDILVRSPRIRYEIGPDGGNLNRLFDNIARAGASAEQGGADSGDSTDDSAGQSRDVIVEHLLIEGAEVVVSAPQLGLDGVAVPLPKLELRDLGKDKGGVQPELILAGVAAVLQQSVAREIAGVPSLQSLFQGDASEAIKGVLEDIDQGAKSLGDAVKGLFGN